MNRAGSSRVNLNNTKSQVSSNQESRQDDAQAAKVIRQPLGQVLMRRNNSKPGLVDKENAGPSKISGKLCPQQDGPWNTIDEEWDTGTENKGMTKKLLPRQQSAINLQDPAKKGGRSITNTVQQQDARDSVLQDKFLSKSWANLHHDHEQNHLHPVKKFSIYCDENAQQSFGDLDNPIDVDDDEDDNEDKENDRSLAVDFKSSRDIGNDSLQILDQAETFESSTPKFVVGGDSDTDDDVMIIDGDLSVEVSPDAKNHINFSAYSEDVITYLLEFEKQMSTDHSYMERQPEINWKMRSILIDWLVEVSDEYKLKPETLFVTVSLIDRFLTSMSVSRQNFQLLGTSALFISSKYEEIYPPEISDFVYITDDSYTKYQVLNMEKLVLKAMQFNVSSPTSRYFLDIYSSLFELSDCVKHMAEYLIYLSLLDGNTYLKFWPSEIAMCSVIVAANTYGLQHLVRKNSDVMKVINKFELDSYPGKDEDFADQQRCRRISLVENLLLSQQNAPGHSQQAVYTKFSDDGYSSVALKSPVVSPTFLEF